MTGTMTPDEQAFWSRFQAETGLEGEPREIDGFGDSPEMMDALLALVLSGRKQATASLARWYEAEPAAMPKPGDLSLVTDGAGRPACVIRTTRVDVMPVRAVDEDFAWTEGEGDRSLAWWRDAHRAFWTREAEREGLTYSDDLDVVCERFELVWAPAEASQLASRK